MKLYDGYSGAMVHFVNKVAEQFPDKVISTLAYQYTRSAPTKIIPKDNVNIMFCSIECNRSMPLISDPIQCFFQKRYGRLVQTNKQYIYVGLCGSIQKFIKPIS